MDSRSTSSRSSWAKKAPCFQVNTSGLTGGIVLAISLRWSSASAIGGEIVEVSNSS